jgi:hypothetical protein
MTQFTRSRTVTDAGDIIHLVHKTGAWSEYDSDCFDEPGFYLVYGCQSEGGVWIDIWTFDGEEIEAQMPFFETPEPLLIQKIAFPADELLREVEQV